MHTCIYNTHACINTYIQEKESTISYSKTIVQTKDMSYASFKCKDIEVIRTNLHSSQLPEKLEDLVMELLLAPGHDIQGPSLLWAVLCITDG